MVFTIETMAQALDNDWHLRAWLSHFGKNQTSLVTEAGFNKSTANFLWHGRQPYRRDYVNRIAAWLGLRPYELLMHPSEALAIRGYREAARMVIAAEDGRPFIRDEAPAPAPHAPRTGTSG